MVWVDVKAEDLNEHGEGIFSQHFIKTKYLLSSKKCYWRTGRLAPRLFLCLDDPWYCFTVQCPRWLKTWCSSEKDLKIDLFNDARNLGSSLSPNQTFVIIIMDWEMKKTDKMFVWSVSTCAKHPTDLVLQQKALHWRRKHTLKKTSLLTENSPSSQGLKGKHPVFKTDECFQSLRGGGDVSIL